MIGVSIIIACYNPGDLLYHCLDSIFSQSYDDIEVILINDGSTDNSEEIALKYFAEHTDKMKYIASDNKGVSAARNAGIVMAKGKYIAFVDADDFISEDYIQTLFSAAESHQSEMVVSGQNKVKPDGTIIDQILYPVDDSGQSSLRRLNNHGKIYLREFLIDEKIEFPVGKIYEDNLFNLNTYFWAKNLFFLKYTGYNQVVHEGSLTSKKIFYEQLPLKEMDLLVSRIQKNTARFSDEKLFEFTVISFACYFIFVRSKRKEYLRTGDRKSDVQEVLKMCRDFQNIIKTHFKKYLKNPFFRLFKHRELQLSQKIGVIIFAFLTKTNLLQPFVKIYYRL